MDIIAFIYKYRILIIIVAIIIGSNIVSMIYDKYRRKNSCVHGVSNPRKIRKDGTWKCKKCYVEYIYSEKQKEVAKEREQRIKREEQIKQEEERIKKERDELRDKYIIAANSVRAKLCSTMLKTKEGFRRLDPYQFEDFCAYVYKKNGYAVEQTPYSNDGGKDAIAKKNGKKILIECKRWDKGSTIGRPLLQKLLAAMVEENADEGHFIATCRFAKDTHEFAKKFNIRLIDMEALCYLAGIKTNKESVFDFTVPCMTCGAKVSFNSVDDEISKICSNGHVVNNPAIDPMEPRCPLCDSKLKYIETKEYRYYHSYKRYTGKTIKQYGCTGYPKCHFKMSISDYEQAKNKLMNGINEPVKQSISN